MQQTTFQEYLNHRLGGNFQLEDPFTQMEYLLSAGKDAGYDRRLENIRYKAGLDLKTKIDDYVRNLSNEGIVFKDISFRKNIIVSAEEIYEHFYSLDKNFSIPNRIELVKQWLLKELKKKARQERTKSWVEEEMQFLDKEDYLEAYNELQKKDRFTETSFDDLEMEQEWLAANLVNKRFKPIISKVKRLKFIAHSEMYRELFVKLQESGSEEEVKVASFTLEQWNGIDIFHEDATPFIYLQDLIEGRKSNTSVRHVFIDEAQDYTPFQFAFIRQLFPYSKMTLLGDMNQAIYSGATGSPTALTDSGNADSETFLLTRTYRSTKQIVEFTRELIPDGGMIEPFNREGGKPTVIKVRSEAERDDRVIGLINRLQSSNHRTIAVICRTAKESRAAFAALKGRIPAMLVEKGTISYEKGITIIPSYLAKGIEFDAVIVYDCSQYVRASDRKLFYTACTRAMHELHLIATGEISPLMADTPAERYEIL
jgi:DNA helicase II / ATP-dependent DNA helicase PcrA